MQQTLPGFQHFVFYITINHYYWLTNYMYQNKNSKSGVTSVELRLLHCTTRVGTLGAVK